MLKHNKFISGILAFAISTSIMAYSTTIKVNAEAIQLEAYSWEKVKNLPVHETVDPNGITWGYQELSDGTLYIVYTKNTQAHMEVPSQLNGKTVSAIGDAVQYPEYRDYLTPRERMDSVLQSIKIPSTVKFIAPNSFNCANLTDVQLSATTWVADTAFMGAPWRENQRNSQGLLIINNKLFSAKNQSGDVIIPSNIKEIARNAFTGDDNITSITIPSSVTEINKNAFISCNNVKNIIIKNGISEINDQIFSDCINLESITIPNSVTKIGEGAFAGCSNLKSITIPDSVTEIGPNAFFECSSLKDVKICSNNIHLSRDAFDNCPQLTSIELPSNASIENGAFDDGVTIINDGTSYIYKSTNSNNLNTGNNTESQTNISSNQGTTTVIQGWHKDGDYWNWLWSDGTKRTGWYTENGEWYYFYGNGQMATEFIDLGGGYSYYLKPNSDGKAPMVTGWQYIDGDWFYFNPNSDGYRGAMKRACWNYIGGNWYYFYYDGTMAHNTYIDGYYVNSSGAWSN